MAMLFISTNRQCILVIYLTMYLKDFILTSRPNQQTSQSPFFLWSLLQINLLMISVLKQRLVFTYVSKEKNHRIDDKEFKIKLR